MQKIRKNCMHARVIGPILAIFLLWAGMFVCLLPEGAYAELNSHDAPGTPATHQVRSVVWGHAGSDCVETDDGSAPTYCKTDGKTVVLSDVIKVVGVAHETTRGFYEFVPARPNIHIAAIAPLIRNTGIFLLVCSFLK